MPALFVSENSDRSGVIVGAVVGVVVGVALTIIIISVVFAFLRKHRRSKRGDCTSTHIYIASTVPQH